MKILKFNYVFQKIIKTVILKNLRKFKNYKSYSIYGMVALH